MLLVCCDVAFLIVRSPVKHGGMDHRRASISARLCRESAGDRPHAGKLEIVWFSTCPLRARRIVPAFALIAIADSVTAAMAEDADHGGALRPHLTARAASVRKSRRCGDRLPSSKRAVSIL